MNQFTRKLIDATNAIDDVGYELEAMLSEDAAQPMVAELKTNANQREALERLIDAAQTMLQLMVETVSPDSKAIVEVDAKSLVNDFIEAAYYH